MMRLILKDDKQYFYDYFSDDDLLLIADTIREVEKEMSGEIRIAIRPRAPFTFYRNSLEKLAKTEFIKHRMNEAQANLGVLFYILLKEKKFAILTTNELEKSIPDNQLMEIRENLSLSFSRGLYTEGIIKTIRTISQSVANIHPIDFGTKMDDEKMDQEVKETLE